jgi:type II secretory pathway pseudopilin PulG
MKPSSVPRPRLALGLGGGHFPAARFHPAANFNFNFNLNLNLNESPKPRAPRGSAFTLIELMVAAAITTLLLLGMTGIFDQSMKAWRLSSRRGDAEREIRAALGTLQRDLGGLVVTNTLPMYVGTISPTLVGISSSNFPNLAPTNASGAWSNVSTTLFFSTTQAGAGDGDVAGVGYYVAWSPTANEGRGAWNLYRYYQRPASFLTGISNFLTSSNRLYQANGEDEIVGANVLNFWAQLVVVPPGLVAGPSNLPTAGPVTNRPSYIQMELTAYGSEVVRNFGTRAEWGNTNNIKKFGRSFIWRVDL